MNAKSNNIEMFALFKTALLFTFIISKCYKSERISKYMVIKYYPYYLLQFHERLRFHLKYYKKG